MFLMYKLFNGTHGFSYLPFLELVVLLYGSFPEYMTFLFCSRNGILGIGSLLESMFSQNSFFKTLRLTRLVLSVFHDRSLN